MDWDKFCASLQEAIDTIGKNTHKLNPQGKAVIRTVQGVLLGLKQAVIAGTKKSDATH